MAAPRLLACFDCDKLIKIPAYTGPSEYDVYLNEVVAQHQHMEIPEHLIKGGQLFTTDDATYQLLDFETQVKQELAKNHIEIAEIAETFRDDAMKCFNEHGRPTFCGDYETAPKLVGRRDVPKDFRQYICYHCLTGDTQVPTRWGTRTLVELAVEGSGEILVAPTHGLWGTWRTCPVRSYGVQDVFAVTLSRDGGRTTKVVRATGGHRWVDADLKWMTTFDLRPGMVLRSLQATPLHVAAHPIEPSAVGIGHGFIFGDGHREPGQRPASALITNPAKIKDLRPYFLDARDEPAGLRVVRLPRSWKDLPPLAESRSYLLGWLAGYFAADGHVDRNGQAVLYSSVKEHLQYVRDVCYVLGVQTSQIRSRDRKGFNDKVSALHQVSLRVSHLPESFWVREMHRVNVMDGVHTRRGADYRRDWMVVSVVDAGSEEVFCPEVSGSERFALADNLMTGNCPVHSNVIVENRWKLKMYK